MTQLEQHQLAGEASRLLKADQDAKALGILEKLSIMLPDHVDIQTTRAFCLGKLDRFDEAYMLLGHIETLSDSPRIGQTRDFLNARKALIFHGSPEPEEKQTTQILYPVLNSSNDTNAQLSRKLESLQKNIEREFEEYRQRDEDAQRNIHLLQKRLRDKEGALQTAYAKNVDLETLLSELGEEVSELQHSAFHSGKPQLRVLPEPDEPATPVIPLDISVQDAEIERLGELLNERDRAISEAFRKNAKLQQEHEESSNRATDAQEIDESNWLEKETAWESERTRFEKQQRVLKTKVKRMLAHRRLLEEQLNSVTKSADEFESKLETAAKQTAAYDEDTHSELERVSRETKELKIELRNAENSRDTVKSTVESMYAEKSELQEASRATEEKLVESQRLITIEQNLSRELQQLLSQQQREKREIESENNALKKGSDVTSIEELSVSEVDEESEATIFELNSALESVRAEQSEAATKLEGVKEQLTALGAALNASESRWARLLARTVISEKELREELSDTSAADVRVQDVEAKIQVAEARWSRTLARAVTTEKSLRDEISDTTEYDELSSRLEASGTRWTRALAHSVVAEKLLLDAVSDTSAIDEVIEKLHVVEEKRDGALKQASAAEKLLKDEISDTGALDVVQEKLWASEGRWARLLARSAVIEKYLNNLAADTSVPDALELKLEASESRWSRSLTRFAVMDKSVRDLQVELTELLSDKTDLQGEVERAENGISNRDGEIEKLRSELIETSDAFDVERIEYKDAHAKLKRDRNEFCLRSEDLQIQLSNSETEYQSALAREEELSEVREQTTLELEESVKSMALLESESDELRDELRQSAQRAEVATTEFNELKFKSDALQSQLYAVQKSETELGLKIEEKRNDIESLRGFVVQYEAQILNLNGQLSESKVFAGVLQSDLDEARDNLNDRVRELEVVQSKHRTVSIDLENVQTALIDQKAIEQCMLKSITTLEESLSGSEQRVDTLSKNQVDLKQSNTTLNQELSERGAQVSQLNRQKSKLQNELEGLQSVSGTLREHEAELQQHIVEHKAQLVELTRSLRESQAETAAANKNVEARKGRIRELDEAIIKVREEGESLTKKIQNMEREIAEHEFSVSKSSREIETLKKDKAEDKDALVRGEEKRDDLQAEVSTFKQSMARKETELEDARAEQQRLHLQVDEAKAEWETLRNVELPEALEQKVEAFRESQRLRDEIEMLRKQIW